MRRAGEDAGLTHNGGGRGVCFCRLPAADVCVAGAPKRHPLFEGVWRAGGRPCVAGLLHGEYKVNFFLKLPARARPFRALTKFRLPLAPQSCQQSTRLLGTPVKLRSEAWMDRGIDCSQMIRVVHVNMHLANHNIPHAISHSKVIPQKHHWLVLTVSASIQLATKGPELQ